MVALAACERGGSTKTPQQHYENKEAALAHFEEPERDAWAMPGRVVDTLNIGRSMDVADIGAGSGYFTRRLAHAAPAGTTYAVDVDADFKGHIEGKRDEWGTPNIVTRLAVYEHPLLPKDSVDLVFISNTYSFLQDRATYFAAVYKALRPGGRLAVIDWRADADCPRSTGCPKPNQRVPQSLALRELAGVGFVVLEEHEFLPYQYFLILGRRSDQSSEPEPAPLPDAAPVDDADAPAETPADGPEQGEQPESTP
ncbi:MAG: class I SAM-dependent methyltransferase [Myxococcales bacterium]|nr:class I SAM-dependent methyltransferase [Myxococcales bacterium]